MTDKSTKIDDAKVIKDLKKLNRRELLEIMLAQGREIDSLNEKVAELEAELHSAARVCAEEESAMPQQEPATAMAEHAMPVQEPMSAKAEPPQPERKLAAEKAESGTAASRESAAKPAPAVSSDGAPKPAPAAGSNSAAKPKKSSESHTAPRKNTRRNRSGKHSAKRRGIFGTGIRLSIGLKTSEKHSEKR